MRVVATAGHVDHGKSTLLRAITGMEPDRWEEERRRGLSIDLGFVWTDLPAGGDREAVTVAFVDVPGHERFVPNMLAGAGGVSLALLVVAADDGWSAQSQEHLDILELLGVPAAVVAVTKADIVGDARSANVAEDVTARLADTTLADAPVLVVDAVSGRNVDALVEVLADRLAATPPAVDAGRPRLWIDRSFAVAGAGTVVTGTLAGGRLVVGEEVGVLPAGRTVRVRGLHTLGQPVEDVGPGSRVAINLAGVDHHEIARGDAVVGGGGQDADDALTLWRATDVLDAWVTAVGDHEIGQTGDWHVHAGSAETVADLHPLLAPVTPGEPGHVRLELARPLPLVAGDRFVVRESGRRATVGGGEVLDPDPPVRPRGPDARLARSDQLDRLRAATDRTDRLVALVESVGGAHPVSRAVAATGVRPGQVPDELLVVGEHLVTRTAHRVWSHAVEQTAAGGERQSLSGRPAEQDSQRLGASRTTLFDAAGQAGCPAELAAALVGDLVERGRLVRHGSVYATPQQAPALDAERRRRSETLVAELAAAPFQPPALDEAARRAGVDHEQLNELVQSGELVTCGGVTFAATAIDQAVERLVRLEDEGGRFTTAQARTALDTTRKYAVPLLEHLDRAGITEFDGQTRRLREGFNRSGRS